MATTSDGPNTVLAPVALYVHFPFCLSVCPYCDFVVYGGRAARGPDNQVARFVDALVTEIELRGRAAHLGSVYLGGGTPSLLAPQDVARILAAADDAFGIADGAEITIEVNPGPSDRGDLAGFAAAGVNRVSIGVQSTDAGELARLGRRHSATDVVTAVAQARAAGIPSISLDLLYDVPRQTIASWCASLDVTLALEPDHVSAYGLTLPDSDGDGGDDHLAPTAGAARWRERARREQEEDRAADMYELADKRLERAGLDWYEISNWARPGHESRHNQVYWHGGAWEAVGPGAHAYDGIATRRWNAASLELYLQALEAGRLPLGGNSVSAESVAVAESVVLRLRTASGVNIKELGDIAEWAAHSGLIEPTAGERVRLTRRGRLLSNELFERLMPARDATVPQMPIEIRRATEDDWQIVRDIRLTALQQAPFAFGSTYERERHFDEQTWRGRLSNCDGPTFLAFDADVPVGIDGVYVEDGEHHLVAMWVAPDARRSGVGAALTQAVIDWVAARGERRLLLGVAEDNEPARKLYESLGFLLTGNSEPLHSDPSRLTLEMGLELARP